MTKIVADISMSLDGFVTGPDPDLEHGLGRGGEPLHTWAVQSTADVDAEIVRETTEATGAVVMGRKLFDIVDGPHGWSDEMGYGAGLAGTPPFFVVTHSIPQPVRLRLRFTFVTDGLEAAVNQAREAAGGKDVFSRTAYGREAPRVGRGSPAIAGCRDSGSYPTCDIGADRSPKEER